MERFKRMGVWENVHQKIIGDLNLTNILASTRPPMANTERKRLYMTVGAKRNTK